ncbi:MAG: DEAD/DEAH box helicase [Polaromonas sp.]|uniref:DEAD/DEAH box helicase n=1 Tax=Polaromonas sp. TaxID=1869339 RepID=UPI0027344F1C|nr:DEAD/DEAH box helicase [Polaromonas sp.]MDP3798017.1 DEAD/DEAH box helicase [Polaromonas sp.]
MPFSSLGFSPALLPAFLRAIGDKGYLAPTDIQSQAIPAILLGRDVVGSAQTGSGKTAAFALPMLQQLAKAPAQAPRRVRGLILVPTRELAAQVGEAIAGFAKYLPQRVKVAVVFGGVSINPQMMNLRGGADIVVATPGRLIDLLEHNALKISEVSTLVLDEADRLLDLGFGEELGRILEQLPHRRQNLFFSATFPPAIEALAASMLHNPLRIEVQATPEAKPDIAQRAIQVDASRRTQLLRHLVQTEKWERVLVFVATKHAAEIVADKLRKVHIEAEPFHGELSQGKRTQVLQDFKIKAVQVVVATDVAARGIDIAQMPVVVNYDLPRSAVDYTHRIGRTGRAGESGLAVSFVSAGTEAHFELIEKRQGIKVQREQVEGFEPLETLAPNAADPASTGGIKGKRPSKKDKLREAAARAQTQDK